LEYQLRILPSDHPFWEILAGYIAQACVTQICQISPEKIVLGGGVIGTKATLSNEFTRKFC
jgi:predicted NBD/HSP70 family sugar kinase